MSGFTSADLASGALVHTVNSGPLIAAIGVSVVVGVVGFLSPCVLPLVPGYLSYVAGLSGTAAETAQPVDSLATSESGAATAGTGAGGAAAGVSTARRPVVSQRRMISGALLFVLGFTAVFVAAGALFGSLGSEMLVHHTALERTFGVITILMGLVFIGKIPFMQRELKVHRLPQSGLLGAPLLGLTFGLAWTPCLTPTLTAVFGLATSQATAGRGAVLSVAYCLGLGLPFILVAMGIGWVTGSLAFLRRHAAAVSRVGGSILILFGILLLTGVWDQWIFRLNAAFAGHFIGSGL